MSKVEIDKGVEVEMKSKDQMLYEQIIDGCNQTGENLVKQKKVNDMMKRGAEMELKKCT